MRSKKKSYPGAGKGWYMVCHSHLGGEKLVGSHEVSLKYAVLPADSEGKVRPAVSSSMYARCRPLSDGPLLRCPTFSAFGSGILLPSPLLTAFADNVIPVPQLYIHVRIDGQTGVLHGVLDVLRGRPSAREG